MRRRYLLRLRPRPGSEAGMTILELVLAMTVMLGALLTIAHSGTAGLAVVTKSRQRQEAAALSSQTLERMRALPFDTLVAGLDNGDLANAANPAHADYDPAIDAGTLGVYKFGGEIIARGDRTAPVDPLFPHLSRDVDIGEPGGTVYDVASYVTHHNNVLFSGIYRLTVVVAWDDAAAADGRTEVMSQSLASSPAGCRSTTTHPFSGPCRPFFYGVAGFMGGQISIGPSGPVGPLVGVNVESGRLDLPSFATSLAVEQTQTVNGVVTMSGGTMTYADATPDGRVGFATARSQATNDITKSGVGTSSTSSVPATSAAAIQGPGASATYLQSALEGGDLGSSVSTVGATGPDACYDESSPRLVLATLAPCGNASVTQGGNARLRMALDDPVLDLTQRRYARVSGAIGYAGTYRDTLDSSTTCPVVTGSDRCVRSFAHRELDDVRLMRLPSEVSGPAGFGDYLVRLQGFEDDVSVAVGEGLAPAPTATITNPGTITYWDGSGYSTMAASATPGTPIPADALDFTEVHAGTGTLIRVRMTPNLTTGGTAVDASACADPTEHCGEARSYSPILGTITFQIDYDGVPKVAWTMAVDLGTIVATTTYKEPPSVL